MAKIDFEALRQIVSPDERYTTALSAFEEARKEAATEILQALKEKGIPLIVAASIVSVDVGGLSKRLRGNFTLPPQALVKLCYSCLNRSVHQIFCGEEGTTVLPKALSVAIDQLRGQGAVARNCALQYAISLRENDRTNGAFAAEVPFPKLLRSRLNTIADDEDSYIMDICGADAPPSLKFCLRKSELQSDYVGRINTQMYIALSCNTSIDGIISQNPVPFTSIRLYGKKEIITDKSIREIASIYYDLSPESRQKLFVYLEAHKWESEN